MITQPKPTLTGPLTRRMARALFHPAK